MKKQERERPKTEDVPLYRSYGVKRRETVLDRVLVVFYRIVATLIFLTALFALGLIIVFAVAYLGLLTQVVLGLLLLILLLYRPCRFLHKRRSFVRKLKRLCKRQGWQLTMHRGFFASLRHKEGAFDFSLDMGKTVYDGTYLTLYRYNTFLTFLSADRIQTKKGMVGRLAVVWGFVPKPDIRPFVVGEAICRKGKRSERAVILNPVPHSMFVKNKDGETVASGSGERQFGYVICTGSGFLETLQREAESQ